MADTKRILWIEDEEDMIDLGRLILERKGFEVLGAIGGKEGLEVMRREMPDLILLDLMMPDVDGWEVFRQMRADERLKDIPIIVVTAKAGSMDKVLGLDIAKVDDYVTKPFGPLQLLGSVNKVLQAREQAEQRRQSLVKAVQALTFRRNQLRERWEVSQGDEKLVQLVDEFARLTSGAIHDLRSGVGVINANIQMLHEKMNEGHPWYNELDRIARAARYCELLVENLSEIRFKGEFRPRPLNFNEPLQEALSLVRGKTPSIEFIHRSNDGLPKVDADARQLKQVFLNLFRAVLGTRTETSEVPIVVKPLDAGVYLEIINIGRDIPSTKAFDLNVITRQGNYNIELYIVKKVVNRHNGKIDIKAIQGTSFNLWLPASQEAKHFSVRELKVQRRELTKEIAALERKLKDRRSRGEVEQLPHEINKLASGVVADLFNELGIIENTASLMLRAITQDDPLYERLFRVSRGCEYCRLLAKNLLSLGVGERPALQPVDIEDVLRDVVKVLGNKILPNIKQIWDVDVATPKVLGDELGLKQIFMNLVTNALEAIPQDKPGILHVRIKGEANWALVEIMDNGCGIPLENQDRIFALHFTTKPRREGGIGLYVVKSIIDRLQGAIEVESQEGQGTRVIVRLPVAKEA